MVLDDGRAPSWRGPGSPNRIGKRLILSHHYICTAIIYFMVVQRLVGARSGVGTAQLRGTRYHWLSYLAEAFAI